MWMEYKYAKTANMEPDPVSKFTKTNIDSASLEATLEPGPAEVGLGWVNLPFRPEFFGMGLLSCLKQIRYSLHSPPLQSLSSSVISFPHPPPLQNLSSSVICFPTPAESVPLSSMLSPPLQSLSPQSVKKRRQKTEQSFLLSPLWFFCALPAGCNLPSRLLSYSEGILVRR